MPKYTYVPIKEIVEERYLENTNNDVYEILGQDADFDKATLIVEAEDEFQADRIRMGITDIRMWKLITD